MSKFSKSFGFHPAFNLDRIPGQVPPRVPPPRLDPKLEVELRQTKPWSVEALLAHSEPRYRAAAVVRDLGLDTRTEDVWARRIEREANTAPNELVYRRNLMSGLHETTFSPELRRVFMQRAGAYYRTLHKAARLVLRGSDALQKGTGFPPGTTRHWRNGKTYRKDGDGKWRPVAEPGHTGVKDVYAEGSHLIVRGKAIEILEHRGDKLWVRDEATGREGELTVAALEGFGVTSAPERAEHVRKKRAATQVKPRSGTRDQGERGDPRVLGSDGERTPAGGRDDGAHGEGAVEPERKPEVAPPAPESEAEPPAPVEAKPTKPKRERKLRAPKAKTPKDAVEERPRVPAEDIKPDAEPRVWKPTASPAITQHAEFLPEITQRIPEDIKLFPRPTAEAKQLFSHQVEGAERILTAWEKGDGFILMDDAGLGKTNTALAAMKARGGKRNLVVVPTSGKRNLKDQWKESGDLQAIEIKDLKDATPGAEGTFVLSYDEILENHIDENGKQVYAYIPGKRGKMKQVKAKRIKPALAGQWDTILFDESHTMQEDGERANAAIELQTQASKVLYMSATPFTNISNMHYLTKLGLFSKRSEFVEWARMAGATVKNNVVENPPSFVPMTRIAATLHVDGKSLKREGSLEGVKSEFGVMRKEELTKEEKRTFNAVNYLFDEANKLPHVIMPGYADMARPSWARQFWEVSKARKAIDLGKQALAEGKQVAFYTSFKEANHAHVRALIKLAYQSESYWMGRTGPEGEPMPDMAKATECAAFAQKVEKMLSKLPKIKPVVEQLTEAFGGPDKVAEIHGATTKDPSKEQKAYQKGEKKVVVATMARGGTGISLHDDRGIAPRVQINLSLPWSGREYNQVAGRSHRLGSKSNTVMHWLVGDDDTERKNGATVARRLKSMGSLAAGNPDQTLDAGELEAWEWGTDQQEETDDPEELVQRAEAAKKRAERLEESAKDSARAKEAFREFATQRASGRDVIGERHQERVREQAKARELEHRRSAEQLKTLGIGVTHDRQTGEFHLLGPKVNELTRESKAGWGRSANRYSSTRILDGDQLVKLARKLNVHAVKIDMGQVAREAAAREKAEREEREAKEAAEKARLAAMSPLERHVDTLGKVQVNRNPRKRLNGSVVTLDRHSPAVKYGDARAGDQGVRVYGGTFDVKDLLRQHGGRGDRDASGAYYYDIPAENMDALVSALKGDPRHDMEKSIRYAIPRLEPLPDFIGEILWNQQVWGLVKGAGHKYIRRVDTGRPGKRRYKYYYTATGGEHLAHDSELTVGSAFKVTDAGKEGHFHILSVDDEGEITIRHDESGTVQKLSRAAFRKMLHDHHAEHIETKRSKLREQLADVAQYGSEKQKARVRARADKFHAHFGGVHPPKPKEEPKPTVPEGVRSAVKGALDTLRNYRTELDRWRKMGARYEAEVAEKMQDSAAEASKLVDEFLRLAKQNGVDGPALLEELGGRASTELSPAGADWLREKKEGDAKRKEKPAPKILSDEELDAALERHKKPEPKPPEPAKPEGHDEALAFLDSLPDAPPLEPLEPGEGEEEAPEGHDAGAKDAQQAESKAGGNLRDVAAGQLGAKLNALEAEGWEVVAAPKDARMSQQAILGRLPGGKVKQLLEAGITLQRREGAGPAPEPVKPAVERFVIPHGTNAAKRVAGIPEDVQRVADDRRFDPKVLNALVGMAENRPSRLRELASSLAPNDPNLYAEHAKKIARERRNADPEGAAARLAEYGERVKQLGPGGEDLIGRAIRLVGQPKGLRGATQPKWGDTREHSFLGEAGKTHGRVDVMDEYERIKDQHKYQGDALVAAVANLSGRPALTSHTIYTDADKAKAKAARDAETAARKEKKAKPKPEPKPLSDSNTPPEGVSWNAWDAAKMMVGADRDPEKLRAWFDKYKAASPKEKESMRRVARTSISDDDGARRSLEQLHRHLGLGELHPPPAPKPEPKPSTSGGTVVSKTDSPADFAAKVLRVAQGIKGEEKPRPGREGATMLAGRLGDQVTIVEAWKRTSGMSLDDFKSKLLEALRGDHIRLSSIDLPTIHDAQEVEQSRIHGHIAGFGYIRAPYKADTASAPEPAPEPAPAPKPAAKETWEERDRREQKKWSETNTAQHDVESLASKIRAAGYDVRWRSGIGDASQMDIVQVSGKGAGKTLNSVSFRPDGEVQIYATRHKTTTNAVKDHLQAVHGELESTGYARMKPKPGAVKPAPKPEAPAASGTRARLIEGKHTKHGHDIWTVQLGSRVDREKYNALAAKAKALGGYYSSFKGNGAIPGFIFKNAAKAREFHAHASGGSEE